MVPSPIYCETCGAANQVDNTHCFACEHPLVVGASETDSSPLLRGRYRILVQVGTGGFGAVYKAVDTHSHGRIVAIKRINLHGLKPREVIEATDAFNREVSLLSDLKHPNLPRIYDHFTDPEHWYAVLDFIEGKTLEEHLQKVGSLPLHEVLHIASQLCTVLDYLHTRQPPIIFRDLKPANIMRTPLGQLYLIDFGIARYFKPGQAKDTMDLGSPGYAAPEQYGKAQTTARADIYSLGAVLHQLLSGNDPSETPFRFAPLRLYGSVGLSELETLIMQMVEMEADKRPATISEVKEELQRIATLEAEARTSIWQPSTLPPPQTPPPSFTRQKASQMFASASGQRQHMQMQQPGRSAAKGSRRKFVMSGLKIAGLTLLGARAISSLIASIQEPAVQNYPQSYPPTRWGNKSYTYHSQPVLAIAWSPGGNYLASASSDRTVQIWTAYQPIEQSDFVTRYLGQSAMMNAVAWSPDGTSLAFSDEDTLSIGDGVTEKVSLNLSAGPEQGNSNTRTVIGGFAWSPDDSHIALPCLTGIQVWDTTTGALAFSLQGDHTISSVAWSPDGNYLAAGASSSLVQMWDINSKQEIASYNHDDAVLSVAWSPDSSLIASASSDKTVRLYNPGAGELPATYSGHTGPVHSVVWSPDGRYIASGSADNGLNLQVWSPDIRDNPLFSTHAANSGVNAVTWSPDGQYIAAGTNDNTVFVQEVMRRRDRDHD